MARFEVRSAPHRAANTAAIRRASRTRGISDGLSLLLGEDVGAAVERVVTGKGAEREVTIIGYRTGGVSVMMGDVEDVTIGERTGVAMEKI